MENSELIPSKFISKRLKHLREQKEWSQRELAEKLEVELHRISKYERGIISPTADMLVKLADVFEVSVDSLLRGQKTISETTIINPTLHQKIQQLEVLSSKDQKLLAAIIDAFIDRS